MAKDKGSKEIKKPKQNKIKKSANTTSSDYSKPSDKK